jgi:hypothetical protein
MAFLDRQLPARRKILRARLRDELADDLGGWALKGRG